MYDEVEELFHEDEVELTSTEEADDEMLTLHVVDALDELADNTNVDVFTEIEEEEPDRAKSATEDLDEFDEEEVLQVAEAEPIAVQVAAVAEGDDDGEEDEDVEGELPLDAILYEQEFGADLELDEGEPEPEPAPEHWPVAGDAVTPVGTNEFVCRECFLVKHRRQLADVAAQLCADCA
jgi:hypothetical protein